MPSNYPGTLDVLTNPAPTDPLASVTVPHSTQHTNINDIIEAIQAKLGIGTSAPVAGSVFGDNGVGGSLWRQIANGDIATAAAIALSKLAPGSSGLLKSNGTAISAGNLLVNADVASNTISGDKITTSTLDAVKITPGTVRTEQIQDGGVFTADLADGAVTTAKLAARAATSYGFLPWTTGTSYGPGGVIYSGGGIGVGGLIPGASVIISIVNVAIYDSVLTAILNVGTSVDIVTALNLGNASATVAVANAVIPMTSALVHGATATSHTYYPLTYANAGTHGLYSTQLHTLIVLHR